MASDALLAEFQQRAEQGEQMIAALAAKVDALKATVEQEAIARLSKENEQLREQITQAKADLVAAEVAHGKRQIPLPGAKAVAPAAVAPAAAPKPAAAAGRKEADATAPKKPEATAAPRENQKEKEKDKAKPKKEAAVPAAAKDGDDVISVARLDLRVGRITKAEKHPDADGLYLETIETGEAKPRTVISGLAGKVPLEQMQNRLVVLCMNLKPAKMRGIVSEAMVMCASTPEKVEVLDPPPNAEPGDVVEVPGYTGTPDEQLNPKKKIFEQVQPDFLTDDEFCATYKGERWVLRGKGGVIKAQTMAKAPIK